MDGHPFPLSLPVVVPEIIPPYVRHAICTVVEVYTPTLNSVHCGDIESVVHITSPIGVVDDMPVLLV